MACDDVYVAYVFGEFLLCYMIHDPFNDIILRDFEEAPNEIRGLITVVML